MAGDRGRRGHRRADEVRPPARALAALEVAVRGRRAALARPRACRGSSRGTSSSRRSPLEAGPLEDARRGLPPRPGASRRRARHDHRAHARVRPSCPPTIRGGGAQVLDPRVRARADEDAVDGDLARSASPARAPCSRARARPPSRRPDPRWRRDRGRRRRPGDHAGVRAPGDLGRERAGVDLDLAVELGVLVGRAARATRRAPAPSRRPAARRAGPRGRRTSCRRARPSPRARRPRSTCCRSSSAPPSRAPRTTSPGVLDHVPDSAVDADLADRAEDRRPWR